MSRQLKHAWLHYRLLLWLLRPPLGLLCLWQALRYRDSRFFWQRLGFGFARQTEKVVWLHAASVGEIHAVLPLLRAIQASLPGLPMLVSTTTPSGGRILRAKLAPGNQWCYLPIDWPRAMRRFLEHVNPRCAIMVETEIWPHLYQQVGQGHIPLLLINGRLSDRSLNAPAWILALYRASLIQVTALLARSSLDQERFLSLGCRPERSETLGNIKFHTETLTPAALPMLQARPYVLAASTHADEEILIARAWLEAAVDSKILLVIAPRHPKRRKSIQKDLAPLNLPLAVRSQQDHIHAATRIYLADTLGEMPNLMTAAKFVIMGGSFVPTGGHNILEAAALGKAVITGPWMEGFREETDALKQAGGLIQCTRVELATTLQRLLTEPERATVMGNQARQLVQSQQMILQRYLTRLLPYLG